MNRLIIACTLLLASLTVSAQNKTLTAVFENIPSHLLIGVEADSKAKLTAKQLGDTAQVKIATELGGTVDRLAMTDNFISLRTSSAGTLQIVLLPLINGSQIVCVVKTVCGKACDSYVQFYTTDWNSLENSGLLENAKLDWFLKTDIDRTSEAFVDANAVVDMLPVKIVIDPSDLSLSFQSELKTYLAKETYAKLEPYLNDSPKVLKWNKASFR